MFSYVDELIASGAEHLLLVDDGSSPEKKAIFETLEKHPQCTVLTHPVNMGKGRALKDTLSPTFWNSPSGRVWASSPLIPTASIFLRMCCAWIRKWRSSTLSVKAPSCWAADLHQDNVPLRSSFGNLITSALFHLLYGVKVTDTQTGLGR